MGILSRVLCIHYAPSKKREYQSYTALDGYVGGNYQQVEHLDLVLGEETATSVREAVHLATITLNYDKAKRVLGSRLKIEGRELAGKWFIEEANIVEKKKI